MLLSLYLGLAAFALLASGLAMRSSVDWLTRLLGAAFAMVSWGVWAMRSFEITVHEGGQTYTHAYPELGGLGAVAAVLMGLFVLRFGLAALREDPEQGIEPDTTLDYSDR